MLLKLRKDFGWPQEHLAAVLGVPKVTLRRWESGERQPSGGAKKIIWLLHTLYFAPERVRNDFDLATWGGKFGTIDPLPKPSSENTPEDYCI